MIVTAPDYGRIPYWHVHVDQGKNFIDVGHDRLFLNNELADNVKWVSGVVKTGRSAYAYLLLTAKPINGHVPSRITYQQVRSAVDNSIITP